MKPACIVYITDVDISRDNGAGVNERAFVTAAIARPEMVFVLPSPRFSFRIEHPRVEYVYGHYGSAGRYPIHVLAALMRLFRLRRRYDIRAVATRLGLLPAAPLLFSWRTKAPLLLKTHSGYEPLDRLRLRDILLPVRRCQRRRLRLRLMNFMVAPAWRAVVRRAAVIDTPSPVCKETVIGQSGRPADRIAVIPNGTNIELFSPRDRAAERATLGAPPNRLTAGYVGALNRDKRCMEHLVRALAVLSRKGMAVGGLIVGEGPERAALEDLARTEGIADRVRFTGVVPYERVPRYMAAFDVGVDLCAAPMKAEGGRVVYSAYSQKMAQYLACGVPVIAWDLLDNRFIAEHGLGVVARLFDVADLAAQLERLLTLNDEERVAMQKRCRRYAEDRLSYSAIADQRIRLWNAVLANLAHTAESKGPEE